MAAKKKKGKGLGIVITLLVVAAVGAGGYFGYTRFIKSPPAATLMPMVTLKAPIIEFSQRWLPPVFAQMRQVNDVIVMVDAELQRLEKIAKEFPDHKQIVDSELELLQAEREKLSSTLTTAEKEVETIYVSYAVNENKGKSLIRKQTAPIQRAIAKAVKNTDPLVKRLQAKQADGLADKILKFLGL